MAKTFELKCPRCGSRDVISEEVIITEPYTCIKHRLACMTCEYSTHLYYTYAEAYEEWTNNERT